MFHELLTAVAGQASPRTLVIALIVAGAGCFFWLIGSRFSRSIFALGGVAAGTLIGLRLPRWFGWEIDAMAFAIGGALVLGLTGYLFHRMWLGTTFGLLLATVGAMVAWHRVGSGDAVLPWTNFSAAPTDLAREIWTNGLAKLPKAILIAASVCMTSGGLIAWMWPKVSRVLTFSMLGTLLFAGGSVVAMAIAQPGWLSRLPASTQTQGIGLTSLMILGAAIQWMLLPRVGNASVRVSDETEDVDRKRASVSLTRKEARA